MSDRLRDLPTAYVEDMPRKKRKHPTPRTGRDLVPGFARMVDAARKARGWSVADLADRAGVSFSGLYQVIREERAPSLRVASAIVKALGLTVFLHAPAVPAGPPAPPVEG